MAVRRAPHAIGADDAHHSLTVAETQFGGGEQTVDDDIVPADAVIDELAFAFRSDDEERRHLALTDAARELDEDLSSVIEGATRAPGRPVAFDAVAEPEIVERDVAADGKRRFGFGVPAP